MRSGLRDALGRLAQRAALLALLPIPGGLPGDRSYWQRVLGWNEAYEQSWQSSRTDSADAGVLVHALDGPLYLVQVATQAHARQPGQIYYVYDRDSNRGRLLSLAWIGLDADGRQIARESVEIRGQSAFDSEHKILRLLIQSRQACGEMVRWRFYQGRPLLKEVKARSCSAAGPDDPERWPMIWPLGLSMLRASGS